MSSPPPHMTSPGQSAENISAVTATFASSGTARNAIQSLGMAGINGEEISLSVAGEDQLATDAADARLLIHILRYIIIGAVIGTIVGAAISPLAGWVVLILLGWNITARAMLTSVLLTTLVSHMIGGFVGYTMAMQAGRSWELSFHTRTDRPASVTVRSEQILRLERAERILEEHHAVEVRRLGS